MILKQNLNLRWIYCVSVFFYLIEMAARVDSGYNEFDS